MKHGSDLLGEHLRLHPVGRGCVISSFKQLLQEPYLHVRVLGALGDRVEELVREHGDLRAILLGDPEHVEHLTGREALGEELAHGLLRGLARLRLPAR